MNPWTCSGSRPNSEQRLLHAHDRIHWMSLPPIQDKLFQGSESHPARPPIDQCITKSCFNLKLEGLYIPIVGQGVGELIRLYSWSGTSLAIQDDTSFIFFVCDRFGTFYTENWQPRCVVCQIPGYFPGLQFPLDICPYLGNAWLNSLAWS